jgi:hypothetical protein
MADWPVTYGQGLSEWGKTTGISRPVLVAESGSANTKGAWTELIASTGFDAEAIAVRIEGPNSAKTIAVDIGIGVTDSEVVLIPDIISSAGLSAGSAQNGPFCVFPLSIKAGTRISVRSQSSTTPSNDLRCAVYLIGQGFNRSSGLALVDTYGVTTTSATNGTVYDPGGTADTKGGWTQIVASTTRDISALMIIATNNENAAMTNAGWFFDVGVGASAAEKIIIPDLSTTAWNHGQQYPADMLRAISR